MSQVEVQAPPGLENVSGCRLPAPPGAEEDEPAEEDWRKALIVEVAASVQAHIELKTATAQETLWQKGQHEIRCIKEQQMAEAEMLQGQLTSCAESCRRLEHENKQLRCSLEVLVRQLATFWPIMSGMPPCGPVAAGQAARGAAARPVPPPWLSPPSSQAADSPTSTAEPMKVTAPEREAAPGGATGGGTGEAAGEPEDSELTPSALGEAADLDAETPPGLPPAGRGPRGTGPAAAAEGAAAPAASASAPLGAPAEAPAFTITLRRADHVLLGLDVQPGNPDATWLQVQAVRPGGAVEAWNRQCSGEMREIRSGDRIIKINDCEDAAGMTEECYMKHLLKMTVVRPVSGPSQASDPEAQGMRADAVEFVPQA